MSDKKITSITIRNESWGLICGDQIAAHEVDIFRNGVVKHELFNGLSKNPIMENRYKTNQSVMENFFDYLENDIGIETWDSDYSVEVCDGWHWIVSIRFSDHHVKKIVGTVEPPPRSKEIEDYLTKIVKFKVDPWMF